MAGREAKYLKALYFDLRVKDLKEHFSETNPNGAYGKIRDYLLDELSWLPYCLNHFEVTNIGANHDLMQLFEEAVPEPETL